MQLRQTNQVKTVPTDAQVIDPDIQVLLVAQAQDLSDATLYALDQFVMRGGRLMAMVDPYSEAEAASAGDGGMPPPHLNSNLGKLFDAWGIVFDPSKMVGDPSGAWRVRASPSERVQTVDYVAWFNIRDGISHDDPATADLQQVTVASSGFLGKKDRADITFTRCSRAARLRVVIPVADVKTPDPAKVLAEFKSEGGPRVIAARVRGVLKSAFAAPPPLPEGQKRPDGFPAYKAQTDGPANLVVVADSDILADRFWVRVQDFFGQQDATPFSDNGAFVSNLIGTLAGGDLLIGLRSRGESIRPFTMVNEMQSKAEATFRQTERRLQRHLDETEKQLQQLRHGGAEGASQALITPEQRGVIDSLRKDIGDTRAQLRAVQLNLNRDISRLRAWLQFFNIVLVPALLAVAAIVLAILRSRRRARARA